jgi:hypothetical protein
MCHRVGCDVSVPGLGTVTTTEWRAGVRVVRGGLTDGTAPETPAAVNDEQAWWAWVALALAVGFVVGLLIGVA